MSADTRSAYYDINDVMAHNVLEETTVSNIAADETVIPPVKLKPTHIRSIVEVTAESVGPREEFILATPMHMIEVEYDPAEMLCGISEVPVINAGHTRLSTSGGFTDKNITNSTDTKIDINDKTITKPHETSFHYDGRHSSGPVASAQTGGASQSASGSRQVITTNENDTREVIDIGYVSNGSTVKIDGRKTVVKTFRRRTEARHCDRLRRRPRDIDGTRETIIIDDLNNPIAIGGFEDPIIVEEPYDYAEDGVYIKNGKEFLFGDSGATPKKARFGVIGGHWAGISFGYSGLISDMGHWGFA